MTNILVLPLLQVTTGVQTDEDFQFSAAYYYSDGATPVSLSGITFTCAIGNIATPSVSILSAAENVISIEVPAASKDAWPEGTFPFYLLATDGTYTRNLTANSYVTVGEPSIQGVVSFDVPGSISSAGSIPVSSVLDQIWAQLGPVAVLSYIAANIPIQTGDDAPVATGQLFINLSGYMVMAQ